MVTSAKTLSATGDVTSGPAVLRMVNAVVTTPGTLTLRKGGSGGTVIATLALAGSPVIPLAGGMRFDGGCHATFGGGLAANVGFWLG